MTWNPPNILTMSRLFLAAVMISLLSLDFPYSKSLALLVFLVGSITDFLDGYLARNVYGVSSFGQLMDPLTDKVMVCAAFICFVEMQLLPAWLVIIIISREFLVTGLRLLAATKGRVIAAGVWGKHKTIWQIVAIILVLIGLALRDDIFRSASELFLQNYHYAFTTITLVVGIAVAGITFLSGAIYMYQHADLFGGGSSRTSS